MPYWVMVDLLLLFCFVWLVKQIILNVQRRGKQCEPCRVTCFASSDVHMTRIMNWLNSRKKICRTHQRKLPRGVNWVDRRWCQRQCWWPYYNFVSYIVPTALRWVVKTVGTGSCLTNLAPRIHNILWLRRHIN